MSLFCLLLVVARVVADRTTRNSLLSAFIQSYVDFSRKVKDTEKSKFKTHSEVLARAYNSILYKVSTIISTFLRAAGCWSPNRFWFRNRASVWTMRKEILFGKRRCLFSFRRTMQRVHPEHLLKIPSSHSPPNSKRQQKETSCISLKIWFESFVLFR